MRGKHAHFLTIHLYITIRSLVRLNRVRVLLINIFILSDLVHVHLNLLT